MIFYLFNCKIITKFCESGQTNMLVQWLLKYCTSF